MLCCVRTGADSQVTGQTSQYTASQCAPSPTQASDHRTGSCTSRHSSADGGNANSGNSANSLMSLWELGSAKKLIPHYVVEPADNLYQGVDYENKQQYHYQYQQQHQTQQLHEQYRQQYHQHQSFQNQHQASARALYTFTPSHHEPQRSYDHHQHHQHQDKLFLCSASFSSPAALNQQGECIDSDTTDVHGSSDYASVNSGQSVILRRLLKIKWGRPSQRLLREQLERPPVT